MPELKRSVFSSEMASLFGLTSKGLMFYEEKGLFSPERSKGGHYRLYEPRHVSLLYRCRLLCQLGMSVDKAIRATREADSDDYRTLLQTADEATTYEIQRRQYMLSGIRRKRKLVERVHDKDFSFTRAMRPAFFWAETWDTEQHFETTESQARCFRTWSSASIMTDLSILLPCERLLPNNHTQWNLAGFLAEEDVADFLGLSSEPTVRRLPTRECVYGIVRFVQDNFFATQAIKAPLAYLNVHQLKLTGDIVTRNILTVREGDADMRYDEIWLPVNGEE